MSHLEGYDIRRKVKKANLTQRQEEKNMDGLILHILYELITILQRLGASVG